MADTLTIETPTDVTPSDHQGMGTILYDGGAAFRVWAPNADAVHVRGAFDDWSEEGVPLASENNGYWSADVESVQVGHEYQYLIRNGEQVLHRNDPYARQVTNSVGNSVVYDPQAFDWEGDAFDLPDWNELVIYEMHVGTFGADGEDQQGTLHSSAERLGYLKDLGISAVELMPLAEFAGDLSWGYNPALPFAVESAYGGPDALKTFVKEAHRQGIAVILDVVYNHFGPSDLSLWQFDGWSENDKGGIYFYNDHRSGTPWGDTRPDFGRPEVRQYILDNAAMWLDEFHIDGLRLDMTPYIFTVDGSPDARIDEGWHVMQALNQMVADRFPGALVVAEDLHTNPAITEAVEDGGAGFGAQWDAAFVHPVREALIDPTDEGRDVHAVQQAVEHRYGSDAFQRVVYTESHDEVANGKARVAEEVWNGKADSWASKKRATLGTALVLTAPGIPMLFQGQALLEDGYFQDTDALDWSRAEQHEGLVQLHRDLIHLRRNLSGTTAGLTGQHVRTLHLDPDGKVLAFHRWRDGGVGDDTVIIVNLSETAYDAYELDFPHAGAWTLRFNSDWEGYDPAFNDHQSTDIETQENARATVRLGAYTALIYSQDLDT